jgi:hypothetical protein
MIGDVNDPLEADPLADDAETPEPRVVVVYRSRGVPWLLIPPLLLVAAVAAIIAYRKSTPPEIRVVSAPEPTAVAIAPKPETVAPEVPKVAKAAEPTKPPVAVDPVPVTTPVVPPPAPIAVETTVPTPAPPAVETSIPTAKTTEPPQAPVPVPPAPTAPPIEPQAAPAPIPAPAPAVEAAVGFDPEAAKTAVGVVAEPKAEKANVPEFLARPLPENSTPPVAGGPIRPPAEDVQEGLQREAEGRIAERAKLEVDKPDLLNPSPREIWQRRRDLITASRRVANEDRVSFHAELREIVAEHGARGGPLIQRLCNKYGRDTMPEIHGAMNKDLTGPASRLSVPGRIQRMRKWGIPETIVLDDLVINELDNFSSKAGFASRGGPRSEGEAWVRAAKILLANPPIKPAQANASARTTVGTPDGQ